MNENEQVFDVLQRVTLSFVQCCLSNDCGSMYKAHLNQSIFKQLMVYRSLRAIKQEPFSQCVGNMVPMIM